MQKPFSENFKDAWAKPSPEGLVSLLHDNVVLYQPHRSPIMGKRAALKEFSDLLAAFPGLYGEVDRWLEEGDVAFIEWRLIVPVNDKTMEIPMVDRFFIADGLGLERKVYFDQWQLARLVLLNPKLLPGLIKYSIF